MSKVLELNGFKYSFSSFDDYELRCKVKFNLIGGKFIQEDLFTTDTDVKNIEKVLEERKAERVVSIETISFITRGQDDMIDALLNGIIKGL